LLLPFLTASSWIWDHIFRHSDLCDASPYHSTSARKKRKKPADGTETHTDRALPRPLSATTAGKVARSIEGQSRTDREPFRQRPQTHSQTLSLTHTHTLCLYPRLYLCMTQIRREQALPRRCRPLQRELIPQNRSRTLSDQRHRSIDRRIVPSETPISLLRMTQIRLGQIIS
jgi:hypothetical protein